MPQTHIVKDLLFPTLLETTLAIPIFLHFPIGMTWMTCHQEHPTLGQSVPIELHSESSETTLPTLATNLD